jgi:hypothetical protein
MASTIVKPACCSRPRSADRSPWIGGRQHIPCAPALPVEGDTRDRLLVQRDRPTRRSPRRCRPVRISERHPFFQTGTRGETAPRIPPRPTGEPRRPERHEGALLRHGPTPFGPPGPPDLEVNRDVATPAAHRPFIRPAPLRPEPLGVPEPSVPKRSLHLPLGPGQGLDVGLHASSRHDAEGPANCRQENGHEKGQGDGDFEDGRPRLLQKHEASSSSTGGFRARLGRFQSNEGLGARPVDVGSRIVWSHLQAPVRLRNSQWLGPHRRRGTIGEP